MIQRWKVDTQMTPGVATLTTDDAGGWCKYTDVAADAERLRALMRELVGALQEAKRTIRTWSGLHDGEREPEIWEAYQVSPEMRRINSALTRADSELAGQPQGAQTARLYTAAEVREMIVALQELLFVLEITVHPVELTSDHRYTDAQALITKWAEAEALRLFPEPGREGEEGSRG